MDTLLIILAFGIFLGFYVQTVIGFAGALISLPILLTGMSLPDSIAYISIFYFIASPFLIYKEWKHVDKKIILKLTLSSLIGVVIGIIILVFGKPVILKKALGIFILCYVLYSLWNTKKFNLLSKMEHLFGFLGGFFSGVFSTGGPLYVIIVKDVTPDIRTFRATMFGVLGLVTFIRMPVLAIGGVLNLDQLYNSLYVLPFFILALFLGKKTYHLLNETILKKAVLGLLFISGLVLLVKA
ncbi:sulfite exporter TauE/SafE family protein [Aquimarina sp. 2201CG5-10]|uniref:sulfite exporter TauE/SafE family protein n=1 Tax=Aquimarina callyspongiae TaxID=3098150 RepID=UPI002AB3C2B7|nr:sulfite exporter TauE/SafE family protein [Aquimarina sp. 2201CG5-10]MDY8135881.1 sulfite exporter TauE/SafE family protein [Aquimarina sp. 2201CG5-10]